MVLVWLLLAVLLLVVALLAVPLEWTFKLRQEQGQREGESHIRWLFGLVRVRTDGSAKAMTSEEPEKTGKPIKKARRSKPLAAIFVEGFVARVLTLVRRLITSIHIHHLDLHSRIGLGDPADTGRLWAFIGPLGVLLAQPRATSVRIEPDFYNEVLDFTSDGRIHVVPLRLLWVVLGFLVSPNTWRAWRATRVRG